MSPGDPREAVLARGFRRGRLGAKADRALVLVPLLALVVSCGGAAPEGPPTGAWTEADAVEEVRIGLREGPDEYLFGARILVAAGRDGSMFISDGHREPQVRLYDAAGRFVRDVGGPGQGPGEYGDLLGMLVDASGRLVVWERAGRLTYFSATGDYIDDEPVEARLRGSSLFHLDGEGVAIIDTDRSDLRKASIWKRVVVRVGPDGTTSERVPLPDAAPEPGGFVLPTASGLHPNFTISTLSAWSPRGYLITGRSDVYRLEVVRAGEVVGTIVREWEPVAVAGAERVQWEAMTDQMRRQRLPEHLRNLASPPDMQFREVPEFKPAFKELRIGEEGLIWVRPYVEARFVEQPLRPEGDDRTLFEWREPNTWDVFEPDGEFLGRIVLPDDVEVTVRRGPLLWGRSYDRRGVIRAVRLRIEPIE